MPKLLRITTIPLSLDKLLTGQLRFMSSYFDVIAVSADGPEIETIKKREGCDYLVIPMTRTISPFRDYVALLKMIKLIKREKPTIVHSHTPKAGLIAMLAAYYCKTPIRLHTVAGLPLMETTGFKKQLLVWVERVIYRCANYVYPNSLELKRYIEEQKFTSSDKLKVLGNGSSNGIDVHYFERTTAIMDQAEQLKRKYAISSTNFVFIFIGRIVKDKGINELVNAFDQLNKKHTFIKLILVGPFEDELDPIHPNTRQLIRQNNAIITTGFINDIRPYLAASHVLVFPSYREGFPNAPLQAGCFELPMIVSDINGCNEIVQDGVNGLVVPPKNEIALQKAMETMIVDEALRERCAKASRSIIVHNYSRETVWNALLEEYKNLLMAKRISLTHVSKIPETSL